MGVHLYTASELRERPGGWTFDRQLAAVRQGITDHTDASQHVLNTIEKEGRAGFKAGEQRTFDEHQDEVRRLKALEQTLVNSPEGREVDYRSLIETSIENVSSSGSETQGYDRQGRHTGGGHVYEPHSVQRSWVKDMIRARDGDVEARDRLIRNNREFTTENRALAGNIAGSVGEFVPPVWLMDQLVRVARPGRVFADQINGQPLAVKTNTIDIPRMATGTAVAQQATENTGVQNTDATSDAISSKVITLSGQQIVSVQLLDQSPVPVDQILLEDMAADLAVKVDAFTLSANATGQVGVLNLSGVNAVSYTDTTPTTGELYPKIADAIQRISTSRYMPPTKIFMHPRRWAWLTAALDNAGRPLVVPIEQAPQNAQAAMGAVTSEGLVGTMQGLPVFVDPNLPTNGGGATNQDPIIVARTPDLMLWESAPVAIVDRYSLAGQLSVRLVLREYVAVQHGRYPSAVSIIAGTGLTPPTF